MADFRIFLFDRRGRPIGELHNASGSLDACRRSEEINGEHSLSITTNRHLDVGTRALTKHADGRWREWVVDEPSESHGTTRHAVCDYHLCWSIQYDLKTVFGKIVELGTEGKAATARQALKAALDGTDAWKVGRCDVTNVVKNLVLNRDASSSAWDRLSTIVKYYGGEIDADIRVDRYGVVSRKVDLLKQLGSDAPYCRFEWSHNMTGITRTPAPGPYVCRVIPLAAGQQEDSKNLLFTYEVKTTIRTADAFEYSNGMRHSKGSIYLRDLQAEAAFKTSFDGGKTFEYPTVALEYDTQEGADGDYATQVKQLMEAAKEDLFKHTRPLVSYTGSLLRFREAGLDTDGIVLGGKVQVDDRAFHEDVPLRIEERVLKMDVDELRDGQASVEIGKLRPTLEKTVAAVAGSLGEELMISEDVAQSPDKKTLSHYTVEDDYGESYQVPTTTPTSIASQISDIGSAVSGISSAIDSGAVGGDMWVHQVDGVTLDTGTINFVTGESDKPSLSDPQSIADKVDEWGTGFAGAIKRAFGFGSNEEDEEDAE